MIGVEEEFINNIFEKYIKSMNSFVNRITNDRYLAEDVIQEGFLKIIQGGHVETLAKMEEVDSAKYMFLMIRNIAFNFIRKHSKETLIGDITFFDNRVAMTATNKVTVEDVEYLIERLPPKYTKIITEKYINDKEDIEIAKEYSITLVTVRKRLERGREKLRREYEIEYGCNL